MQTFENKLFGVICFVIPIILSRKAYHLVIRTLRSREMSTFANDHTNLYHCSDLDSSSLNSNVE